VTNEIAFTVMISLVALAGFYMMWWIRRQERKEEHEQKSLPKAKQL